MKQLKIILYVFMICFLITSCEKTEPDMIENQVTLDHQTKQLHKGQDNIVDVLVRLHRTSDGSFEIKDRRINPETINRFLIVIGADPIDDFAIGSDGNVLLGKKRCTKWKNGRRFCVQRLGFLHWKFGTEHCGGGSEC